MEDLAEKIAAALAAARAVNATSPVPIAHVVSQLEDVQKLVAG